MMTDEPRVTAFVDEEERELVEAIEADDYTFGESLLTPELFAAAQAAARATLAEKSTKVSIRLSNADLARVKARALHEGVPYQTLIKSIIHRAVT